VQQAGQSIRVRRLGGKRSGEIRLTRWLRNPAVKVGEMAETAAARTAERCVGRHLLAIQDTTVVRSEGGGGQYLHAVLGVDAEDGAILGLVDGVFLHRDAGRKAARRALPVAAKESQRWLEGAKSAAAVGEKAARVTVVADRESDIYEAFARCPPNVELLVRAAQDRSLEDGGRLFAWMDAQAEAGRVEINLPARPGRRARGTILAVRFGAVRLARPRHGIKGDLPDTLGLHLVDVREVTPPAGEPPIHWRLLTTHQVVDVEQALDVVELYRKRWAIEQLFRTMKTQGFDIEGIDIEDDQARTRLVMAALVAAITVQQLVHARDGGPGPLRPLTDAFEAADLPLLRAHCRELEGKTARQKNPHPEGSLAYAAWVCARLGGWTGYYGKPGPIVMLNGWTQFQTGKAALRTLQDYRNL
jgi:hypothetical protein